MVDGHPEYLLMRRGDFGVWQWVAGGAGEKSYISKKYIELSSLCESTDSFQIDFVVRSFTNNNYFQCMRFSAVWD